MKATLPLFALLLLPSLGLAKTEKIEFKDAVAEVYKEASGDKLWIYRFEPMWHHAEGPRPAIVFFFGGGWTGGTPTQFEQHARYLASRGMVAFVADYRVKSRQGTTGKECASDGKSAVRWIRANAKRLGIDPDRIAAGGGSAGGHVAAFTGMCDAFDDPADKQSDVSSKPNALALFNPVFNNGPGEEGWGHAKSKEWFPDISPAHNITKDDPPAIVFLGTKDKLIPVSVAEKFKADMEKAGLKSELHLYEDQPHGFFNENKGGTEIFLDTIRKMDAFFVDLGWLEGVPGEKQIKAASKGNEDKKATNKKRKTSQIHSKFHGTWEFLSHPGKLPKEKDRPIEAHRLLISRDSFQRLASGENKSSTPLDPVVVNENGAVRQFDDETGKHLRIAKLTLEDGNLHVRGLKEYQHVVYRRVDGVEGPKTGKK